MLTTPIINPIKPFCANNDYELVFYVNGGNQILRNNLIIEDMVTGLEIYNKTSESFGTRHIIPSNTLTNGVSYKAKIRTGGSSSSWSQFSDYRIFYCFSQAIIEIPTIDYANQNRVYSQTVNFNAVYSQNEGETLQSYRFLLYDDNKNLIKAFPEKFYQSEQNLNQEIAGLNDGILYYVQVKTESVNGLITDTDLIWFKPFYITPQLSVVLTPENISDKGAIKVSANIIQIIGKLYDDKGKQINPIDIEHIDGEWLDLTRTDYDKLIFDEGINMTQSDFSLKIWCKNIPDNKVFLNISGNDGHIRLIKRDSRIHAFKTHKRHTLKAHFVSNIFDFDGDTPYVLCMKQISNLIDMFIKKY